MTHLRISQVDDMIGSFISDDVMMDGDGERF